MKIYNIVKISGILTILFVMSACNDFLAEVPNRGENEVLNKGEQIKKLFANSDDYYTPVDFLVASSDDYGMTTNIFDALGYLDIPSLSGLSWAPEGLDVFMSDELWTKQYNKIFHANAVINEIDNISDITNEERSEYLAHAHFVRALAYWELVNVYCLPYAEENLQALGLPLKKTTHSDENMTRATLKDTYAFIESDLKESLKSPRMDVDKDERWLVSQPAAKALIARFYLFTGDYEKAQKFADEALKSKNATLLDYNNLTTYTLDKGGSNNEETDESINNDTSDENSNALTYCETYNYATYQFVNYQEL